MTSYNLDRNAAGAASPAAWRAYAAALTAPPQADAAAAGATWRRAIAACLGATASQVRLVSGGTEANASALAALIQGLPPGRRHLLVSAVDHAAVRQTLQRLAQHDSSVELDVVPADAAGRIELPALRAAVRPDTGLLAVCMACNETGVLQPLDALAPWCRRGGLALHVDAVQVAGRQRINFAALQRQGVSSLAISGHKVGAVGGIGAYLIDAAQPVAFGLPDAAITNPPGAASLAAALTSRTEADLEEEQRELAARRDHFERHLQRTLDGVDILGGTAPRLGNTSCLRIHGMPGDGLMMALDLHGYAVSTGSACSSGSSEPSAILLGMGLTPTAAQQTIRLSISMDHTETLLDALADQITQIVHRARQQSNDNDN